MDRSVFGTHRPKQTEKKIMREWRNGLFRPRHVTSRHNIHRSHLYHSQWLQTHTQSSPPKPGECLCIETVVKTSTRQQTRLRRNHTHRQKCNEPQPEMWQHHSQNFKETTTKTAVKSQPKPQQNHSQNCSKTTVRTVTKAEVVNTNIVTCFLTTEAG